MSESKPKLVKRKTGDANRPFLKKYSQIVYAIILIILIPLVIIGNTLFIIGKFQKNTDAQLQRQALSIAEVFDAGSFNSLSDIYNVQTAIDKMLQGPEELQSFDILIPEATEYKIIASSFSENIGKTLSTPNIVIAWGNNVGIAHQSKPTNEDILQNPELSGQRFWNVVFPLHDAEGSKIALLNLKMSVRIIDELTKQTLLESFILLIGTLLIIMGLLYINTRLFRFAVLFRKLEEVDQMKDEFISMASHELRTPITAINGYVSMFLDGSYGKLSDAGKKGMDIVSASIHRLATLVEDLLNVSRIEQQRLQLSIEPINIDDVIQQTIDELKVSADAKDLELIYKKFENLPMALADTDKMRQVLVNIIGNSIKYTKKGSVTISTNAEENNVLVKIKDTGIGIAAKDREQLFSKFHRVKSEATRGIVGTGLGLWITKELINLMGGEIYVDSIENVGTEFSFSIPISQAKK